MIVGAGCGAHTAFSTTKKIHTPDKQKNGPRRFFELSLAWETRTPSDLHALFRN